MSAALIPIDSTELDIEPPRLKFTRQEAQELVASGVFEGRRFELIDGDLIDKMGQNPPHAFTVRIVHATLARIFDPRLISVQSPIEAAADERERSLPEPDVAVLREVQEEHRRRFPEGHEVLLAIEISDTTLRFDLSRKSRLYARAGVREYWVLDMNGRKLIAHRQPRDGEYKVILIFNEGDSLTLESRTEPVAVADLLPTAPDTAR